MSKLPNRIKELREAKDWSLRELAARCGITFTMLNRLENGVTPLDVERMRRIARTLGLPPSALLNDEDVEFRADESSNEIMRLLKGIPPGDQYALLQAAKELVRISTALAARRSAGALRGNDRQVEALADIWNDFDDANRDRAIDLLKASGLRG